MLTPHYSLRQRFNDENTIQLNIKKSIRQLENCILKNANSRQKSEPFCHFPTDLTPLKISIRSAVRLVCTGISTSLPNFVFLQPAVQTLSTMATLRYHSVRCGICSKASVGLCPPSVNFLRPSLQDLLVRPLA
jgi:hypothetical protein